MNWVGSPNTRSSKTSCPPLGPGTSAIPTATRTEPRGPYIEGRAPVAPARGCPQPQQVCKGLGLGILGQRSVAGAAAAGDSRAPGPPVLPLQWPDLAAQSG